MNTLTAGLFQPKNH